MGLGTRNLLLAATILGTLPAGAAIAAVTEIGPGLSSAYSSVQASGNTVHAVSWRNVGDGNEEIFYRRSPDRGVTWGPEVRLTNDAAISRSPSLAVSGSAVHVVWADNRDGNFEIYLKRSADGGVTWGNDIRVTSAAGDSLGPSAVVGGQGIHVVWNDYRDGNNEVYYRRGTADATSWDPETRITSTPEASTSPSLASTGSALHLVWKEGTHVAYRRSLDAGSTWEPEVAVSHPPAGFAIASESPAVAASDQNVQVVFMDNRASSCLFGCYQLYQASSSSGGASWAAERILVPGQSASGRARVAIDAQTVRVAWVGNVPQGRAVHYIRSVDGGQTWGEKTTVWQYAGDLDRPSMAHASGRVHLAWTKDPYGSDPRVLHAWFDEVPDLDVFDTGADVIGGLMRLKPRFDWRHPAGLAIGSFELVNSSAAVNPDPDGPSAFARVGDVKAAGLRRPRPEDVVKADFLACAAHGPVGAATLPEGNVAFVDLVSSSGGAVPAAIVTPAALDQGVVAHGNVIACVRSRSLRGSFRQTAIVEGAASGIATSDRFQVRLDLGWWWW